MLTVTKVIVFSETCRFVSLPMYSCFVSSFLYLCNNTPAGEIFWPTEMSPETRKRSDNYRETMFSMCKMVEMGITRMNCTVSDVYLADIHWSGRNSFLPGFSFSLFVDIHDWTEAKHACNPFSAAVDSPDARETYSWLSPA